MRCAVKSICLAFAVGVSLCLFGGSGAIAAGNPEQGQELAKRLCSNCHIVGDEAAGATVAADVPSFKSIANLPDQSAERVAGRIVVPHPPMPQINVTRDEIRDLATYIMSLKAN